MATARPRAQLQDIVELHRAVSERQRASIEQAKALVERTRETLDRVAADRAHRAHPDTRNQLREELEGLRRAMEHRAVIEQAKGIIMASTGRTPDEAFELLRQQSQHSNMKLRDIAADIVATACRSTLAS
jgi:hypothetical protein